MRVRKQVTQMVEIGPVTAAIRLPMKSRISHGMKTICDACGQSITDEYFAGVFVTGEANKKLHLACCEEQCIAVEVRS